MLSNQENSVQSEENSQFCVLCKKTDETLHDTGLTLHACVEKNCNNFICDKHVWHVHGSYQQGQLEENFYFCRQEHMRKYMRRYNLAFDNHITLKARPKRFGIF
jgi:hypothetical protein